MVLNGLLRLPGDNSSNRSRIQVSLGATSTWYRFFKLRRITASSLLRSSNFNKEGNGKKNRSYLRSVNNNSGEKINNNALWLKKRLCVFFAVFIILAVSFSRIYLGVHFPTDVFAGWFLGLIIIVILWPFFDRIENFLAGINSGMVVGAALILPLLCSLILPTRWSVMPAGALSGFFTGIILERKYLDFQTADTLRNAILRVLSGMFVISGVLFLEKITGISKKAPCYLIVIYVKSWIMGLWISAGAPWMFRKLKI